MACRSFSLVILLLKPNNLAGRRSLVALISGSMGNMHIYFAAFGGTESTDGRRRFSVDQSLIIPRHQKSEDIDFDSHVAFIFFRKFQSSMLNFPQNDVYH